MGAPVEIINSIKLKWSIVEGTLNSFCEFRICGWANHGRYVVRYGLGESVLRYAEKGSDSYSNDPDLHKKWKSNKLLIEDMPKEDGGKYSLLEMIWEAEIDNMKYHENLLKTKCPHCGKE